MQPATRKTLYIELGIKENASRDEVRDAYWQWAKEFHPDKASSAEERAAAEENMSRLNEIMEVLGDDNRRMEYDAGLKLQRDIEEAGIRKVSVAALRAWKMSERSAGIRSRWPARLWVAALACVVAGCALIILMSDWRETEWWRTHVTGEPFHPAVLERKKAPDPSVRVMRQVRVPPEPARSQPPLDMKIDGDSGAVSPLVQEARKAMERSGGRLAEHPPPDPAPPPKPHKEPAPAPAPAPAPVASQPWNGQWKYAENLGGGLGGPFSPVSIEMQLRASGQRVRGVYKARYNVPRKYLDKVEFSFEGWSNNDEWLRGVWQDPKGGKGEFELKKVSGKVVEMNWWTTAFGQRRALASGVARLVEISR